MGLVVASRSVLIAVGSGGPAEALSHAFAAEGARLTRTDSPRTPPHAYSKQPPCRASYGRAWNLLRCKVMDRAGSPPAHGFNGMLLA